MSIAERMFRLFSGLERAHGEFVVTGINEEKNKVEGVATTHRKPPTVELWQEHLDGGRGIGIIPVRDDGTSSWGAIDIDVPGIDLAELENEVLRLGLPLVVLRSKSEGAHCEAFIKGSVKTPLLRAKLADWAVALGHPGVEIFPKQNNLADKEDVGNWLNMPYHGDSHRVAIRNGEDMSVEDFLDYAEAIALTAEELEAVKTDLWVDGYEDAPPCLQALMQQGFGQGERNDGLFNLGVYYRMKYPDDWRIHLYEGNHQFMVPPLHPPEVTAVEKSVNGKNYFYRCEQPPLKGLCDKSVCKTRKFGIGSDGDIDVIVESVTRQNSDPPLWFVEVDGQRVRLTTEEFMSFQAFKLKCVEALSQNIGSMSQRAWDRVTKKLLKEKLTIVEVPEDAGIFGQFKLLVNGWLTDKKSEKREDLLNGLPYFDPKDSRYYFRSQDLVSYLGRRHFYRYDTNELYAKLRDLGADHKQFKVKGGNVQTWHVAQIYDPQQESFDVPKTDGENF